MFRQMEDRDDSSSVWSPTGAERENGALKLKEGVFTLPRDEPAERPEDLPLGPM